MREQKRERLREKDRDRAEEQETERQPCGGPRGRGAWGLTRPSSPGEERQREIRKGREEQKAACCAVGLSFGWRQARHNHAADKDLHLFLFLNPCFRFSLGSDASKTAPEPDGTQTLLDLA